MRVHRAALIFFLCTQAPGRQDDAVFRSTTDLVLLDVQVVHNKTHVAAGDLQAQDLLVFEDGAPQKILFFGRDQLPLSVFFLFDLTKSDRAVLRRFAEGAKAALERLKPEDECAVGVYGAAAQLLDPFTRDRARTAAAIARAGTLSSNEAAFFNQAVFQSAAYLQYSASPRSRRILLWLTDNYPNSPTHLHLRSHAGSLKGAWPHTEEEAIRKLHESGAVVMPLMSRDPFFPVERAKEIDIRTYEHENPGKRYPPGDAKKYAEITGGFAFELHGNDVAGRLAEVIDDLRSLYTIGFRPTEERPAGTFCRIKVALAPDAPLRSKEWLTLAREGYYRK
jgi:VWFA-related protein